MPRQRPSANRGHAAPARPTLPQKSIPAPQQSRPASTLARPSPVAPATPAAPASQGTGLFGQMASTAAGVAVGSSIGHAIGGFFGGGSSATEQAQQPLPAVQDQNTTQQGSSWGNNCATATTSFTKCLDEHKGNMQICNWYLEQLKACQAAASQY